MSAAARSCAVGTGALGCVGRSAPLTRVFTLTAWQRRQEHASVR